jgi:hypothetical protein
MKSERRIHWPAAASVIALLFCVAVSRPAAAQEDFSALVKRLQQEKPDFAKRQQALLAERYDLADRPAPGVTMSGGKPVQEGVRVKLPRGMTWEMLAAMSPEDIKTRDFWPAGFFPLPHPHHEAGGMVFPQPLIDETKRQTDRDLTRFDLDFDLPQHLLPEFPAHDDRLMTLEDTVEFFNLVLGLKLNEQEKKDLVAFLRVL